MEKELEEYLRFVDSLNEIKKIKANPIYDKKSWDFERDYASDFGLFKVSYTAGTFGSSSVSNKLRGLETNEGKNLFIRFMAKEMPDLMDRFAVYYKKYLKDSATKQIEKHNKAIKQLTAILEDKSETE